jgi:hypothetical protein
VNNRHCSGDKRPVYNSIRYFGTSDFIAVAAGIASEPDAMRSLLSLTPAEWEKIEREEHDLLYGKENKPFGFTDCRIDV